MRVAPPDDMIFRWDGTVRQLVSRRYAAFFFARAAGFFAVAFFVVGTPSFSANNANASSRVKVSAVSLSGMVALFPLKRHKNYRISTRAFMSNRYKTLVTGFSMTSQSTLR